MKIFLKKILNKKNKKITVIGDVILDEYISGKSDRLSPESPVPVVVVNNTYYKLGGSGNVAVNVSSLKCSVFPIGVIGQDKDGIKILEIFKKNNIITSGIIKEKKFKTIKKTRVIANNYQIVRYDNEIENKNNAILEKKLIKKINYAIKISDLVILSDYGKGCCTTKIINLVISQCLKNNILILVDPRKRINNFYNYRNCSLITPNLYETKLILPNLKNTNKEIERACYKIKKEFNIDNIIITRSEKGISLLDFKNNLYHFPAEATQVYDVSGAGDTVIATLGTMLVHGNSFILSAKIATIAAGIVISFSGTSPITYELLSKKIKFLNL